MSSALIFVTGARFRPSSFFLEAGRGGGTRDIKSAGERRRGGGGGYQSQGAINYKKKKEEEGKSSRLGSYSYSFPRSKESLLQYFFSPKERLYDKLAGFFFWSFLSLGRSLPRKPAFSPRLNPSKAFFSLLVQAYVQPTTRTPRAPKKRRKGGKGSESN